MFDTMTMTKAFAGVCGALLVFLLGAWAAEELYHGTTYKEQAYAIEVEGGGEAEHEAEIDLAALMDSADAGAGEKLFRQCSACHKLEDGANATGPYLYGVVNRPVGTVDSFASYSGALPDAADVWTPENLFHFLEAPRKFAAGTSMNFKGIKKPQDRANLIAYLAQHGG